MSNPPDEKAISVHRSDEPTRAAWGVAGEPTSLTGEQSLDGEQPVGLGFAPWNGAAYPTEAFLRELHRVADGLGEDQGREFADAIGPIGIGMQRLAASLLAKHRPEPRLPFGGRRVFFAQRVDGGLIKIGTAVDIVHSGTTKWRAQRPS